MVIFACSGKFTTHDKTYLLTVHINFVSTNLLPEMKKNYGSGTQTITTSRTGTLYPRRKEQRHNLFYKFQRPRPRPTSSLERNVTASEGGKR